MDIAYNDGKNIEKQHRRSELVSMGTSEQKHVGGMFQTTISFWTQNINVRKFQKSDTHVCDICARAKITRQSFNKVHQI
jgi:hypothetical protein